MKPSKEKSYHSMIEKLYNPTSIVVVGGSNNKSKPGGAIVDNIIQSNYHGKLYVVNPQTNSKVQNCRTFNSVQEIDSEIELAIITIPAYLCIEAVEWLASQCHTKAFIIISAGFSETSNEGKQLEDQLLKIINHHNAILLGPNCIGAITPSFCGVFTQPIINTTPTGIDFLSASGAVALFFMEAALKRGLSFNSLLSVGNGNQLSIEELIEYLNLNYQKGKSSPLKVLYFESIKDPHKLLHNALQLNKKGCTLVAIKSGSSRQGSKAAQSHTGALINSDTAVTALFQKAGIIRCYGREDLLNTVAILQNKALLGDKIAIITHAGGPAVMLTDTLSNGGYDITPINKKRSIKLKDKLFLGASVSNPIDILATGTPEQLQEALQFCQDKKLHFNAIITIFGNPGLGAIDMALDVIAMNQKESSIPIYPILPSVINSAEEQKEFTRHKIPFFFDEVEFGKALLTAYPRKPSTKITKNNITDNQEPSQNLPWNDVLALFKHYNIPIVKQATVYTTTDLHIIADNIHPPYALKVEGINHKSDVEGVILNISSNNDLKEAFLKLIKIPHATGVIIQEMISGTELFIGAKYEPNFGYLVICGIGGIFVEVFNDVTTALAPVSTKEALRMIESLKGQKIFNGVRGQKPINKLKFAELIVTVSKLCINSKNSIRELDINPIIVNDSGFYAVDGRITIKT